MHLSKQPPRRFLSPGAGQGNGSGYRTKPYREVPIVADEPDTVDRIAAANTLRDEPECISPAILIDYAEANRLVHSQQHAKAVAAAQSLRPTLAAEDRIRDAERRAKHGHRNLSHEFHIMRRDLDRARAGGRHEPPRVLRRLAKIEADLDGLETAA